MNTAALDEITAPLAAAGESVLMPMLLLAGIAVFALFSRKLLRRSRRLTPPEVQERLDAGLGLLVLDVRSREVFARCHIEGAVNVPASGLRRVLSRRADGLPVAADHAVVVVAESTARAERAADGLRRAGFTRVHVLEGGMRGWQADRLPLADGGGLAAARH